MANYIVLDGLLILSGIVILYFTFWSISKYRFKIISGLAFGWLVFVLLIPLQGLTLTDFGNAVASISGGIWMAATLASISKK